LLAFGEYRGFSITPMRFGDTQRVANLTHPSRNAKKRSAVVANAARDIASARAHSIGRCGEPRLIFVKTSVS